MMRTQFFLIIQLFFLHCGHGFGDSSCLAKNFLTEKDVKYTFQEILNKHVEYRVLSPLIIRRAIKLYIDQFDPERIYLLQEEIKPFFSLKDHQIQKMVHNFSDEKLEGFSKLNHAIETAILRSRLLRAEVQAEMSTSSLSLGESLNYSDFAKDGNELKGRLWARWAAYLAANPQHSKDKIFALWEKRHRRFENQYLCNDDHGKQTKEGKHSFCLHTLKALAKSLDAHTAYFSPEEAQYLKAHLEKQFSGIGIFLKEDVEGIVIMGLAKDSPAERSGIIVPGDVLVEINGQEIHDLPYEEVLKKLHGHRHSKIQLGLKRVSGDGAERLIHVNLVRDKIMLTEDRLMVSSEPFADGIIGKLTLPSFYEGEGGVNSEKDVRNALLALKRQGKLYGVVLDVRENLGGFLHQAVKVTGLFMSCGVIVVSKYADGEMEYLRELDGRVTYDGPLIILISRTSASAAEIVAQALQDYGIAIVLGDERSYGKGTIQYQTFTNVSSPAFYKVTVGRYYTVSGRSTQIEGVHSDVLVPTIYHADKVGERYFEFPLKPDHVLAAYSDDFSDVDLNQRAWFQKNYAVRMQKKLSLWSQLLPILSKNSEYRIAHSKPFQQFLSCTSKKEKVQFGDLQMKEAVQVLKDMVFLKDSR